MQKKIALFESPQNSNQNADKQRLESSRDYHLSNYYRVLKGAGSQSGVSMWQHTLVG